MKTNGEQKGAPRVKRGVLFNVKLVLLTLFTFFLTSCLTIENRNAQLVRYADTQVLPGLWHKVLVVNYSNQGVYKIQRYCVFKGPTGILYAYDEDGTFTLKGYTEHPMQIATQLHRNVNSAWFE